MASKQPENTGFASDFNGQDLASGIITTTFDSKANEAALARRRTNEYNQRRGNNFEIDMLNLAVRNQKAKQGEVILHPRILFCLP